VTGTSSLQGNAADATQQHKCACALHTEHPSHSIAGPRQQHGRQGAPGLQHTSRLRLYYIHKRKWRNEELVRRIRRIRTYKD